MRVGYLVARSKKAAERWDRRVRRGIAPVGLSGEALERVMAGVVLAHPEFVAGAVRPPALIPRSVRGRTRKAKG